MAKESGLGWTTLSVDGSDTLANDIRNDVTNFEFSTPRAVQEITGVDKSAMERLLLLADFSITLNGVFNDDTDKSHVTFKDVGSTSVTRTVALGVSGQTLSNECILTDYALTRADDGAFTWSVPGVLADGTVPTWS
jgi:2',3'-cyclic-nucleotide 2'-phosphodiesterase (5'-nucleotidase family)